METNRAKTFFSYEKALNKQISKVVFVLNSWTFEVFRPIGRNANEKFKGGLIFWRGRN